MPKRWANNRQLYLEQLEPRRLLSSQTWDLLADFELVHNPDGPWSYNAGAPDGNVSAIPQLLPLVATNWQGIGVNAWTLNSQRDAVPGFGIATVDHGGGFGQLAGDLLGHSSFILRWTSPVTGTVNFSGAVFHPRAIGRTNTLILRENGDASLPFERHTLGTLTDANTRDNSLQFSQDVDVAAGQNVDLLVGPGQTEFFAFAELIVRTAVRGDFNNDGINDSSDYTVWRDNLGRSGVPGTVPGDGTGIDYLGQPNGIVDLWDYGYWKQHFGDTIVFVPPPNPSPYHPAAIVVQTTGVSLPDGTLLDISNSQTQGLQEAFNFSAEQGWDLFVLPGVYTLNSHLDIEELQLRSFRFEDVTLNFTSNVSDFGIRFDSTMLTNWYWKGGAINATSATNGVLFQPRSPHPKDGIILGTKGVVDSVFHFNVDIFARSHKVTMNTQQATVNDLTFYFKNVTRSQINYIGAGFASYNIAEAARTDDPIPFDLFSSAGRVTVIPVLTEAGSPATVYLPDGSQLSVSGTRTAGLQEALDYAAAHNLDFLVFGRGIRNVAPFTNFGLYNMVEPLNVGDLNNRTYRIYCVTWGNPREDNLLTLGDMINSTIDFTGQLVGPSANNVVAIQPDGPGVHNSSVRIQAVVGNNGALNTAVRINPGLASIQSSLFHVHEVNMGFFGIKVMNPSASTEFSDNLVRTLHTHGTGHIGVQIGESETNASRIYANRVDVRTNTDGTPAEAALQVWGDSNAFDLFAFNSGLHFGAKFEPGSNNNTLLFGTIQAGTPIGDYGTNNIAVARGGASTISALRDVDERSPEPTASGQSALTSEEARRPRELLSLWLVACEADVGDDEMVRIRGMGSHDDESVDIAFSEFKSLDANSELLGVMALWGT